MIDKIPLPMSVIQAEGQEESIALSNVLFERKRQDEKWGEQNHHPYVWLAILSA